ncbi:MAG: SlyX family protein [Pseudomonadota bacterium]
MTDHDLIIDLQTKLAFQEQTILELDEALRAQQLQIINLEKMLQRLRDDLISLQHSPDSLAPEQEPPPPHY